MNRKGEIRLIWKENDLFQIELWRPHPELSGRGLTPEVIADVNKKVADHPPGTAFEFVILFLFEYCHETGYDFFHLIDQAMESLIQTRKEQREESDDD